METDEVKLSGDAEGRPQGRQAILGLSYKYWRNYENMFFLLVSRSSYQQRFECHAFTFISSNRSERFSLRSMHNFCRWLTFLSSYRRDSGRSSRKCLVIFFGPCDLASEYVEGLVDPRRNVNNRCCSTKADSPTCSVHQTLHLPVHCDPSCAVLLPSLIRLSPIKGSFSRTPLLS